MVEISAEFDVTPLVQKLNPSQIREVKAKGLNYAAQETVRVLQRNSPVDHRCELRDQTSFHLPYQ